MTTMAARVNTFIPIITTPAIDNAIGPVLTRILRLVGAVLCGKVVGSGTAEIVSRT